MADVPTHSDTTRALGPDNRCGVRVLEWLGRLHICIDHPQRRHHSAGHAMDLHLSRELLNAMGGSDGGWCVRHGAGRCDAGGGTALYRKWPHGGFGGGVVAMKTLPDVREVRVRVGAPASSKCPKGSEEHTSELQSLRHLVCR